MNDAGSIRSARESAIRAPGSETLETRGVAQHDGAGLAWTSRGHGEPILFVQGVGVHGDGWRPQTDELQHDYRCISFDHRGVGQSKPVGALVTIGRLAEDCRAILDDLGIERAHIVGHSMGGIVAQALALKHPSRVQSLSPKTNVAGASAYPSGSDPKIDVKGGITLPGTYFYQVWYRDAINYCTPSNYNLTNAVQIIWD